MLSAVVRRIRDLQNEPSSEMRRVTIELSASAYPDIRPWQVRIECEGRRSGAKVTQADLNDLYYLYLSLLLHPMDGHDAARRDPTRVKVSEWPARLLVAIDRLLIVRSVFVSNGAIFLSLD
jgi:hypothetical protein